MRPTSTQGGTTVNAILSSGVNFVQFTSGSNIVQVASGAQVVISGQFVNTSVSGNVVSANVSGNIITTSVSGNQISFASGATGNLSGLQVVATTNVVTNVSGNQVYLGSGSNFVFISGTPTVNISGNSVSLSGLWTSTTLTSGQFGISGAVGAFGFAYDFSGLKWIPIPTSTSGIFGLPHVTSSGEARSVSGNVVSTSVSGNVISVTGGGVSISGNVVNISGSIIQPSYSSNTNVRGRNVALIGAASGGVVLSSGDCSQVTIRAVSSNTGSIFVGGVNTIDVPWGVNSTSGNGFILGPGDGVTFPISNLNLVKVAAFSGAGGSNSGNQVSYMGVQY